MGKNIIMRGVMVAGLALSVAASAADRAATPVDERIIGFYSEGKCDGVRKVSESLDALSLRPNIMAIVAACEPSSKRSEELFKAAEGRDPTGDLIVLLHAQSVWKRDPKAAEPLFRKVLMLARHPYMRNLANDYLAGRVPEAEPVSLSSTTFYSSLTAGGGYQSNPRNPDFVDQRARSSYVASGRLNASLQQWKRWGSMAAIYTLTNNSFFSAHEFDQLDNELDLRVSMRVGPNEDLVFRPIGSYATQGGLKYRSTMGIGVFGIIYRPTYKQSVQGMVFKDRLYPSSLTAQQGTHFRFDYVWEFFPPSWLFKSQVSIEHVSSEHDAITTGVTYSHTSVGLDLLAQYDFKLFMLGFAPRLGLRQDADVSVYTSRLSGDQVSKRRSDYYVALQPILTIPLDVDLHLIASYEWRRIYSNMGPADYADRNFLNQSGALSLKAFVSNY